MLKTHRRFFVYTYQKFEAIFVNSRSIFPNHMDDHLSLLQLWAVEKALILYINELNSFATLISDDFDDSDHEDMKILAMDIDNALTLRSDSLFLGLSDENEHTTPDQVRTFINAVHDHIIINQDINFATDIVESDPRLAPVLDFLLKHSPTPKKPCHSAVIIDVLKDSLYDIIAWAELWYIHQSKDIHDIISSRSNSAAMIIARDPDIDDSHINAKDGMDSTKAFRSYFINDYDPIKIAKINARINELGKQKKDNYVTNIAALIAVLFDNKVLSKTFKATLAFIFKRLGIKEDSASYKPAQFKRCSMKGTVPATWSEAESFFNSL